jgi:hypothetical protein
MTGLSATNDKGYRAHSREKVVEGSCLAVEVDTLEGIWPSA